MSTPFDLYLKKIDTDYRGGKATEHTYRSTLEILLETLAPGVEASNDPKHIACGAPDFIVEKGRVPLGYVETKDVGVDLDKIEKTDQLKRYLKSLNNLILTDYLEFRWYVNGERRMKVRVGDISGGRVRADGTGITQTEQMFREFYATEAPTIGTARELASRLAQITHLVRDLILASLTDLTPGPSPQSGRGESDSPLREGEGLGVRFPALDRQFRTFQTLLLPTLKPEEFADLYAQTMAYGLFAAKLSAPENAVFQSAADAYKYLGANRFLRRLFLDVGEELDGTPVVPFLEDIAALLARADFASILKDFGRRTRTEDPVVHFYETFLAQYDPKLRQSRGVYYTPEPVVQFIVRAVDDLLKTRFHKSWGLADSGVKVLDPATGTGTFLYYVIQAIHEEVAVKRGQAGTWPQKSKEILGRIFGFELLMAPYVVTHLKLGLLLRELGAPLGHNERLQVYLNNTLEEGVKIEDMLESLAFYIAEEASQAARVKKQEEVMVVLGNPPYSGHSANASVDHDGKPNFIGKLLREYYFVDGAPLGEKQPKWLQDDYVKFIRFGEWRIQQTGHGILAFITNHGYLDNPTFRGMRQHLMKTFDEIYVLDLHGNSKKKEKAPDGGKDENVFDIQQGVAILLAVKHKQTSEVLATSEVYHAHLWGTRESKYSNLRDVALNDIEWVKLEPVTSSYLFIPQDKNIQHEYEIGWKIPEMVLESNVGFVSARDKFVIDFDKHELRRKINDLRVDEKFLSTHDFAQRYNLKDTSSWNILEARNKIRKNTKWDVDFTQCLYRPFDKRHIYYSLDLLERPVYQIQRHMKSGDNLSFVCPRRVETSEPWQHLLCSDSIIDHVCVSLKSVDYLFPLYLYTTPADTAGTLFAQTETTRTPNLNPQFIAAVEEKLGMTFIPGGVDVREGVQKVTNLHVHPTLTLTPEAVFYYAYAVFHSPTYRTRYAEFLKIDFPRLPLTSDRALFLALAAKGKELVDYHLLRTPKVDEFITTYPVAGDNKVERPQFVNGKVHINAHQYFGNVPENVWNFKVGGYQVCEKWLKDRKGRILSNEDLTHYQRVVVALQETIRLMQEIDQTIPGWPLE